MNEAIKKEEPPKTTEDEYVEEDEDIEINDLADNSKSQRQFHAKKKPITAKMIEPTRVEPVTTNDEDNYKCSCCKKINYVFAGSYTEFEDRYKVLFPNSPYGITGQVCINCRAKAIANSGSKSMLTCAECGDLIPARVFSRTGTDGTNEELCRICGYEFIQETKNSTRRYSRKRQSPDVSKIQTAKRRRFV